MAGKPDKNRSYQIGLVMAGAVSAGAYTAGVIDFLIQALDEWQEAKDRGEANVPKHKVELKVMAGRFMIPGSGRLYESDTNISPFGSISVGSISIRIGRALSKLT